MTELADLAVMLDQIQEDMPEFANAFCADASDDPYPVPMAKLSALLLLYHACKDAGYGRSWARRGEGGVYHNVMRKADRFDKLAERIKVLDTHAKVVMSGHDLVDQATRIAFIDNLVDTALYCQMWVDWIAAERPEDFDAWLRHVWCRATGVDYDYVKEFV